MNLKDIRTAIKAAKRVSGGRVPVPLLNYQSAQFYLDQWMRKAKLAQTKIKRYRRMVKRYQKLYGRDNSGRKTENLDSENKSSI
jgi:thiamine kinase-like enzyme